METAADEADRRGIDPVEEGGRQRPIPHPPYLWPDQGDDHECRQEDGHVAMAALERPQARSR